MDRYSFTSTIFCSFFSSFLHLMPAPTVSTLFYNECSFWNDVALPIGISCYTFQCVSVLTYAEVVWRLHQRHRFGLFVTSFPQLIAGPIVRYSDIAIQLRNILCLWNCSVLLWNVSWRISAKKMLMANPLGQIRDTIYACQRNTGTSHMPDWPAFVISCRFIMIFLNIPT